MTLLLNTSNPDSLYDTLAVIFSTPRHIIEHVIFKNMFNISKLNIVDEIDIGSFKQDLSNVTKTSVIVNSFDYITISHLTTRRSHFKETLMPLYNLHDALTLDSELSMSLKTIGITFVREKNKINTYLNGELIIWESLLPNYEEPAIRMIMRRLEGNRYFPEADKCINGFLFGGDIWENSDVCHIRRMPEIAENILRVLGKLKYAEQWTHEVQPYVIIFQAPVRNIIFDGSNKLNVRQTQYRLLRNAIYYLCHQRLHQWNQSENPIIRLDDNLSVKADQILSITPVAN